MSTPLPRASFETDTEKPKNPRPAFGLSSVADGDDGSLPCDAVYTYAAPTSKVLCSVTPGAPTTSVPPSGDTERPTPKKSLVPIPGSLIVEVGCFGQTPCEEAYT